MDDDPLANVLSDVALLLVCFRDRHQRDPREIQLSPITYRAWRDAGGSDRLQGIPIRCTERLSPGMLARVPAW